MSWGLYEFINKRQQLHEIHAIPIGSPEPHIRCVFCYCEPEIYMENGAYIVMHREDN